MKLYAIRQSFSTFGQTDAGCHSSSGPEEIVAEATIYGEGLGVWETYAEQEAFMKSVNPSVAVPCGRRYIEIPVEQTARGFSMVAEIVRSRTNVQPHVVCGYRLVASDTRPILDAGCVSFDSGNLAYQTALLAGKA